MAADAIFDQNMMRLIRAPTLVTRPFTPSATLPTRGQAFYDDFCARRYYPGRRRHFGREVANAA